MDAKEREALEAAGWKVGDAADCLGLTEDEQQISEFRLMVGRAGGPGFTRTERERCTSLLAMVVAIVRLAYREPVEAAPSDITVALLPQRSQVIRTG